MTTAGKRQGIARIGRAAGPGALVCLGLLIASLMGGHRALAAEFPATLSANAGIPILIGLIDTAADPNNPHLAGATVINRSFQLPGSRAGRWIMPSGHSHGTVSAAAMLMAFRELDPDTAVEIYVANPFVATPVRSADVRRFRTDARDLEISEAQLLAAYRWFSDLGVSVVATTFVGADTPMMRRTTSEAARLGLTLFASAGNNAEARTPYPAGYDTTIAVSGLNRNLNWTRGTGKGDYVDLSAAKTGNGYWPFQRTSGTSFATAYAAGLAAFVVDQTGYYDRVELLAALSSIVIDRGAAGRDSRYGMGALTATAVRDAIDRLSRHSLQQIYASYDGH